MQLFHKAKLLVLENLVRNPNAYIFIKKQLLFDAKPNLIGAH